MFTPPSPFVLPASRIIFAASVVALAGGASAQDSVAATPGGNDALSAYDSSSQRVRYVVDMVPFASSWGQTFYVAPLLKTSRDIDPAFTTQLAGSAAVSSAILQNVAFASRSYAAWSTPGAGVNSTNNTPAGGVAIAGYDAQFGVGLTDFAAGPSNVLGAIVGRNTAEPARLYVERVVAASSRSSTGTDDTATLSLGGVDAAGNVYLRGDGFNTPSSSTLKLLGDNVVRVSTQSRGASTNLLYSLSGNNSATDTAATTYVVRNESTPTNVPTGVLNTAAGNTPYAMALDFANRFRTGSTAANLTNAAGHLDAGLASHRGNPAFSALAPLGGVGTMAALAKPTGATAAVNALGAWAITFESASTPPVVLAGSTRSAVLPSPITAPDGFTANTAGDATFEQYQSQTPFRGGAGQVGIGTDTSGSLVLAATATDPSLGGFIAACVFHGSTPTWTVAAHPGQGVLDGQSGASVGQLVTPSIPTTTTFSAPAVDALGNVYFVGAWKPTLGSARAGLFKAVNVGGMVNAYQLELLIDVGQTVTGANSATPYEISSIELADSDSVASGSLFSQQVIQTRLPGMTTGDARRPQAFGGVAVNATLTYDRGSGIIETYDALLMVAAGPPRCEADFNGVNGATVQDIFDFLTAWLAGSYSADFNGVNGVTVQDIFDFLTAWLAGC